MFNWVWLKEGAGTATQPPHTQKPNGALRPNTAPALIRGWIDE